MGFWFNKGAEDDGVERKRGAMRRSLQDQERRQDVIRQTLVLGID